jgi:hypothetical protein
VKFEHMSYKLTSSNNVQPHIRNFSDERIRPSHDETARKIHARSEIGLNYAHKHLIHSKILPCDVTRDGVWFGNRISCTLTDRN